MFDHDEISDRVARLKGAYDDASAHSDAEGSDNARQNMAVRKLALLKVEQALLIAGF